MNKKNALIVFIKTPVPNQVKTRLQPQISGEESARLYSAFLKDIDKRFTENDKFDCWYAISPKNFDKRILNEFINLSSYFLQSGEDLGEQMVNAFQHLFEKKYEQIVLIGSDIPTLTVDSILGAFKLLQSNECVLGPGYDGGYYLIGLKQAYPSLFENIPWSTSDVFEKTMTIIDQNNITVYTLPRQRDIDTFAELTELYEELKIADIGSADFPSHTWEIICDLIT